MCSMLIALAIYTTAFLILYLFADAESEAGQDGFSTVIAMDNDHLLTHQEPCEVNR